MRKYIYSALLLLGLSSAAVAQNSTFGLNYNIAMPMSDFKDYISATSFRGMSFEYTYVPDENVGVHFEIGWNNFYEKKEKASYTKDNATFTGTQYRYSHNVPILVGLNYFFMPESTISPYAALGLGTMYSRIETNVGIYSLYADSWQFGFKPEIGANIGLSQNAFIRLSAKYYQTFKTNDLDALSYLSFNIGLAFSVE